MNIGGKSCADPAGRGPSSRGLSAGTYADWCAGVTIRLSSDVRLWPAARYRIRGTSVRGWMAYGVACVGESSRRLARGQKESRTPSLAPGSLLSEGVQEALDLLQCLLICHPSLLTFQKEGLNIVISIVGWRLFYTTNKPSDLIVVLKPALLIGAYDPLEILFPAFQSLVPLETADHTGFYECTKLLFTHAERSFELGLREFARASGG